MREQFGMTGGMAVQESATAGSTKPRRAVRAYARLAASFIIACLLAAPTAAQTTLDVPLPHLSPVRTATPAIQTAQASDSSYDESARPNSEEDIDNGSDDIDGGSDDIDGALPDAAETDAGPPQDIRPGLFTLEARLGKDDPPLGEGVHWRIFGDKPDETGRLPILGEAEGGIIYIRLDQGTYFVHVAYGRAGATRKITVNGPTGGEVVVLNAGGMRLLAVNGREGALSPGDVTFDIYAPDEGGVEERFLLIPNASPGHVISLNAGTYHVVSKYGDANAVVSAEIKVEPGKLTEATIFQKAARLTLKLVEQHGGEALADTAWTVVTPKGERVVESVGAFPSVVLAAGDYTARALHDNAIFEANFSVEPGVNHDVEVLAR